MVFEPSLFEAARFAVKGARPLDRIVEGVRIVVVSHTRSAPTPGVISERFEIDLFNADDTPLNIINDPGKPANRLEIIWIGAETVPVYNELEVQIGTKRGADFRTRFWPTIFRVIGKRLLARDLGKAIGAITPADIAAATGNTGALARAEAVAPLALNAHTIDKSIELLTGSLPT